MTDLQQAVAVLFKRKGEETLTEKDFVFSASMDLRWFSPREAQRLLDVSLDRGLVALESGTLRPTFDLGQVEVPLDFAPTAAILGDQAADLFQKMVAHIATQADLPPKEVVVRVNGLQFRMGVYGEMAALLVGMGLDVNMAPLREAVAQLVHDRRPTPGAG